MLFAMQFNEQELHQLREACLDLQRHTPDKVQVYDNLIRKIDMYREEYSCDDYCEIHRPFSRSLSKSKTSNEQPSTVASDRYSYLHSVGTAD